MKKALILALLCAVGLSLAENRAKYLIICADALSNSIQPLAEWKRATGLPTEVVKLSSIGSDTTSIKRFIQNAFDSGPVRPEYVLLVGGPALMPARLYYRQGYVYCSSDNIYADMGGTLEAEIPVGRFPAASAAQLDVMVAKTLMYEKTPDLTDSLWMRRLTTVIREGGDSDDTIYWNNARNAARKAGEAGFVSCDSLSYYRGHNSTSVMNSLNNGTGIVMYRGNAGNTWYTPFEQIRPGQLTSTNKLPIILSITCQTMTLDPYDPPMYGDSFMRAGTLSNLRGAVAFFGNTHPAMQVARVRGAVARGFFDGLFTQNAWKLGKAMLCAKHQMYLEFPNSTSDYRGFNLLGDPGLGIWTATPRVLDVAHPAEILPGPQQLHVSVSVDSVPVPGALVCASLDTVVYAVGLTDSLGAVDLDMNPPDTGTIRLVVTGQNLYPYDGYVLVHLTAVAEPSQVRPAGPVRLAATPAVFTHTCRLNWNAELPGPNLLTLYGAHGRQALTHPVSGSSCVLPASSLPSGVYLAVLRDQTGRTVGQCKMTKLD
ncbi:hypothetical protein FJY70_03185 [candidate division WOR-3 bacterium]|nr:hypothetical protein [candidate division WOR-3 bacterium]